MLVASLFLVSKGLAASAPPGVDQSPRVQAAAADGAPDPAPAILSATDDQLVSAALPDPFLRAPNRDIDTPETLQRLVTLRASRPGPLGSDVECMAKVVYHEAANQALRAQLAVAQVILNRVNGGPAFPSSICGVVNQQGQFFETRAFKVPLGDLARWRTAVAIALIAQERHLSQVAPGALFYHAAYVRPPWAQQHQRIAKIGDQVFYR